MDEKDLAKDMEKKKATEVQKKYFHKQKWLFYLFLLIGVFEIFATALLGKDLLGSKYIEAQLMVYLQAQYTQERIEDAKAVLEIAAINDDVSAHHTKEAETYLKQVIQTNPDMWSHFLIADENGVEIAHTEGERYYGISLRGKEYFEKAWKELHTIVAQPTVSVSTGRKIMAIATPIYQDGIPNGVLIGFIYLEYVSEDLNAVSVSAHNQTFLMNADGTIAAHSNPDFILQKNIADLVDDEEVIYEIRNQIQGAKFVKMQGHGGLMVYMPVGSSGLMLGSFVPWEEAFYIFLGLLILIFMIGGAIVILVILRTRMQEAEEHSRKMEQVAVTDRLTGLFNRHSLAHMILDDICQNYVTALFFDIDDFKKYNDLHDHAYGDDVLRYVGSVLQENVRKKQDVCIRYAGDEFVVLFCDMTIQEARKAAERIQIKLRQYQTICGAEPIHISGGLAFMRCGTGTLDDLIRKADTISYEAKRKGKNCIEIER